MSTKTLPTPSSNHALIVSSSRYWFNYRHVVNALSIYQLLRSNGIPDENIVLMLADDLPSNARNPSKNGMFSAGAKSGKTLYDESIQIDYRGEDVTVENFVRVLLGRQGEPSDNDLQEIAGSLYSSKRRHLQMDQDSNLLIYLTGHGGDQFFKYQDIEEITSEEISRTIEEMHLRKMYREILIVADTCQAFTLGDHLTSPNVFVVASSLRDESSYAHHSDTHLGLSVIERYTHAFMQFVEKQGGVKSGISVKKAMVDPYSYQEQRAHIGFREDLGEGQTLDDIPLAYFFANNNNNNNNNINPQHKSFQTPFLFNSTTSTAIRMAPTIQYNQALVGHYRFGQQSPTSDTTTMMAFMSPTTIALEPCSLEYMTLVIAFLVVVVMISSKY